MTYNIIIYSKDNCPFCDKIHRFFTMLNRNSPNNFNVTTLKLGVDYTVEEFKTKFGENSTFPRVLHDEELIGGCQEAVAHFMRLKRPVQPET